jgi:hypothetical protein
MPAANEIWAIGPRTEHDDDPHSDINPEYVRSVGVGSVEV